MYLPLREWILSSVQFVRLVGAGVRLTTRGMELQVQKERRYDVGASIEHPSWRGRSRERDDWTRLAAAHLFMFFCMRIFDRDRDAMS
jgi:hypothetical protein